MLLQFQVKITINLFCSLIGINNETTDYIKPIEVITLYLISDINFQNGYHFVQSLSKPYDAQIWTALFQAFSSHQHP